MRDLPVRGRAGTAALAIASAVALLVPVSATARDRQLSADRTAANLTAFGQGVAWSRVDSSGRSRLVLRVFGPPVDVPVAPATGRFDPDLGSDAGGSAVAVYTRCAGVSGRNCDVYRYDFDTARESRVAGASTSRCSEFAPSIWEGTVAFARSGGRGCAGLYVKGPRGRTLQLDRRVPADTDIRAGSVAYLHAPSARRTYIRLFSIREGRSQVVVAGVNAEGERTRVTAPVLSGRHVYWLHEDLRRDDFNVGRSRGSRRSQLQFSDRRLPGNVDSFGLDGRSLYYANERGAFRAAPSPRFQARD